MEAGSCAGGIRSTGIVLVCGVIAIGLLCWSCSRIKPIITVGDDCLHARYDQYTYYHPTPIRDHDPTGVSLGPVRTADAGGFLHDVILCLKATHKSTADLDLWLRYDTDHDGIPEASAPVEFYRGRADGCGSQEPHACPMAIDGVYWFRDDEGGGAERPFSVFRGLPCGGDFFLAVSDTLAKDVGSIANWSIYVERSELLTCR